MQLATFVFPLKCDVTMQLATFVFPLKCDVTMQLATFVFLLKCDVKMQLATFVFPLKCDVTMNKDHYIPACRMAENDNGLYLSSEPPSRITFLDMFLLFLFLKDAQEYAHEIGAIFCETSAMTAVNIAELFDAIAKLLPPEDLLGTSNQMGGGSTVNLRNNAAKKKGKCCSGSDTEAVERHKDKGTFLVPYARWHPPIGDGDDQFFLSPPLHKG
uniref:Uncharacterized protein n=1 Tax=Biomphalaria glabrata TaxID=6526 RepID=A0A2C9M1A8_BIOGL